MALLVQKFGGTSVGTIERIQEVAKIITQHLQAGHQVVVVVSAMGHETDRLSQLVKQISPQGSRREYDAVLSTGEMQSAALLALTLTKNGSPAHSFSGWQIPIKTNTRHGRARIVDVGCDRIKQQLAQGYTPIITGFQGVSAEGDITTLGRGGSDTTAVAVAAALKADECQIFTDVKGVYTTDPRIEPKARCLDKITTEEMLELSSSGSKVLQIRAVQFAAKFDVPLRVLSSFTKSSGTLILKEGDQEMEKINVTGVTAQAQECKLSLINVPHKPGIAYQILNKLSEADIVVDMIIQNVGSNERNDFTCTVSKEDKEEAQAILKQVQEEVGASDLLVNDIAKVSIVGLGMRTHTGVATRMFKALAREGINIELIATSEIKVSVAIDAKYTELAVRSLHAEFDLDKN